MTVSDETGDTRTVIKIEAGAPLKRQEMNTVWGGILYKDTK